MKLYHFGFDGYDTSYSVMADNEQEAKESLLNYFLYQFKTYPTAYAYECYYYDWKKAFDNNTLPEGYKLKMYDKNEILETDNEA